MNYNIIWLTPDRFDCKPDKSTWTEMAKSLISYGHNVTILASYKDKDTVTQKSDQNIAYVKSLDLPLIFRFSVLLNMFFWLKKYASNEDIIIINQDALLLIPLLKILGIKKIHLDIRTLPVDTHTIKDRLDKLLYWHIPLKLFSRSCQGYSFITERLKLELDKQYDMRIKHYTIWQSGVSTNIFYPKKPDTDTTNHFKLFYHGTISINRGIGIVIEAIALLEKSIPIEFIIIGTGSGLVELKALTKKLGINDKVTFRGFMPYENMSEEISKADICICPLTDRLEWNVSSPIKVFEYMACGKPMILTPIPAHKDVVSRAPYAIWTDGFKPENFKNAIIEAINNQDRLRESSKTAPEFVKTHFEWKHQAKKLELYFSETFN